jgi:GTP-binding protein
LTGNEKDDPLVVRDVEFLGGMAKSDGWRPPEELPEVAFSGRSNVGKSTLLNHLVKRKSLARVSQKPGKTREINFFRIDDRFILADLPGYGFARVSKEMKAQWHHLIEAYLRNSRTLRGVVQLVDARHPPTGEDLQMLDFLSELEMPTIVVATKIDKLRRAERPERIPQLARELGLPEEQIIPFSAVSREGRDDLAKALLSLIAEPDEVEGA